MFKYEKAYRQGEILFFKVKDIKKISVSYQKANIIKDGAIREGEKEGHIHQVVGADGTAGTAQLTLFGEDVKTADTGILTVKDMARIEHPEHKPIKLPKGDYVVKVQKEAVGKNTSQSVKD
jgi:hypothetical protein